MTDNDRRAKDVDLEAVKATFKIGVKDETQDPNDKIYHGSCHCKHITYTARLNLTTGNPSRCNCSICQKTSQTGVRPKDPVEGFKLITPPMIESAEPPPAEGTKLGNLLKSCESDPDVGVYKFGTFYHVFCKKCGTKVAMFGFLEPFKADMLTVNISSLDDEIDFVELTKPGRLKYWDMKHDNWQGGSKDAPWYPGLW